MFHSTDMLGGNGNLKQGLISEPVIEVMSVLLTDHDRMYHS